MDRHGRPAIRLLDPCSCSSRLTTRYRSFTAFGAVRSSLTRRADEPSRLSPLGLHAAATARTFDQLGGVLLGRGGDSPFI